MNNLDICQKAVKLALQKGATDAACSLTTSDSSEVSVVKGDMEGLDASKSLALNVKVYFGQKTASLGVTSLDGDSVEECVDAAVLLAKGASENPFEGLADAKEIQKVTAAEIAKLDMVDPAKPFTPEEMYDLACEMEKAAYAVPNVKAVRSSDVSQGRDTTSIVLSNGFEGEVEDTWYRLMVDPMAAKGDLQAISYDYSVAFHKADLDSALKVGTTAGEKAAAMMNQVKLPKSGQIPVVFSPEISASFLKGALSGCLGGGAIYGGQSFINKDDLGKKMFGSNVTLLDNRVKPRSLGSSAFTKNGLVGPESVAFVKDGVIENFTMDVVTARKLGMSAANGRPGMYNGYFKPSTQSVADMISDIKLGFYVTGTMGRGFKSETGDISFTVEGYVIRDGIITGDFVLEATMAGNIVDVLNNVTFANDLVERNNLNASTARVDGLSIF